MNNDTSRLDAVAKVTGAAKYGKDRHLANAIYVAFVRCPYGAADLVSTNDEAARKVPGVLEVEIGGKDGKYHGQTVGHIAAESPLALWRAFAALKAVWKRQSVKTSILDGLEDKANPEIDAASKEIMDKAELRHEAVYSTSVQTHSSLETHGACIDHKGDSATVYASTQGTFSFRDGLSDPLGLPNSKFEILCEYVGGGFGSKLGGPGKEGVLAARIGAKYKRPAYVFCNREEEHLDTGNRPSGRALVRMGFNKDGTILGGEIRTWGGTGVARGGGGMAVPSNRYDLGEVKHPHTDVQFNAGGPRAFRAPGHPQAAFVEELMLDEIAAKCGIDPLALRQKIDRDADRREMMEQGSTLIGWKDRKPNGSQTGPVRRGFGMGTTTWGSGRGRADAEVVINRDGSVEARTGTQDIGTGQRTIMAILAAERIGVPLSLVSCRIGSSNLPIGPGSGGSVTAPSTSPAMAAAADDARKQFLDKIAQQAGGNAEEFQIKDGSVLRGEKPYMSWAEACAKMGGDSVTGRGNGQAKPFNPDTGHSHGVQFVDLEVDTQTGIVRVKRVVAIQACGRVVCRKTAESQIIGAVIQGLSFGLLEQRVLDRTTGAMVNANFEMYKILGPSDMPRIEPVLFTKGQTGVRSLGEPPTIPTSGAVACAVFNAIGKPVRHLPITPDRVLAALAGVEGGLS
jgi:xanthine dehydrogenase YagR molybdenum-binding subunit